jgi:SAM-dependent methyltransferase
MTIELERDMLELPCRICDKSLGEYLATPTGVYFRCSNCRSLQKQITEDQYYALQPTYDPGDYISDRSETELRHLLSVPAWTKTLQNILAEIGRDPKDLYLLDVGCGMGGCLLAARDLGMRTFGFEPSVDHGNVAVNTLHLDVVTGYFSPDKVAGRQFDIVILSHVIEHIYHPKEFINDLLSVVTDGGCLAMSTPNSDALSALIAGSKWPMLTPVDHVNMLSTRSANYLVPDDCTLKVNTSEQPWDFLATMLSIAKRKMHIPAVNDAGKPPADSPKLMASINWKARVVRSIMSVLSLPFYLIARVFNRGGDLRIIMIKSK